MKTILNPGDIVIFKAADHWISKSIAWLTRSDVSHAAMICENNTMVEMGLSGISVCNVCAVEGVEGDEAYLLRLNPEKPVAPLVKAAAKYVDAKTRYDIPSLAILAGMIIYRNIRKTPEMVRATDLILNGACLLLDRVIQKIQKQPGKPMVCSQLVYQIYRDCGEEYEIHFEGGLFMDGSAGDDSDTFCLADIIAENELTEEIDNNDNEAPISGAAAEPDTEELARLFCEAMENAGKVNGTGLDADIDIRNITKLARRFLALVEEILEKTSSDLPLDALFVAPSDLAYHAKNLTRIAALHIERKY